MKKILFTIGFMFCFLPIASAKPTQTEIDGTVKLITLRKQLNIFTGEMTYMQYKVGSGTIIENWGLILTNYHVVGDIYKNSNNLIMICVNVGIDKAPDCSYGGITVKADKEKDLAFVRLDVKLNANNEIIKLKNKDDFYIPAKKLKNDLSVGLGDDFYTLGFPSYGGENLTLTKGIMSGYDDGFIKTDAKVNPGNSGGGAYNQNNEFVGVVSAVSGGDGNIGLIIPIKTVIEFLSKF